MIIIIIKKMSVAIRTTKNEIEIMSFLEQNRIHPTAKDVFNALKDKLPKLTLMTTYRNLNKLVELGRIISFEIDGVQHFDACTKLHQHFFCKHCKKIYDIDIDSKIFISKIKPKQHLVDGVDIIFYGICDNCLKNIKGDKHGRKNN